MTVKISSLVDHQLPNYYKEEYPKFTAFLKTYYQFLEQEGYAIDILINQQAYDDIDRTLDKFIPYFKNQYAELFPDTALVDKRLLIKHIKDFYLSKGSEESFKMFFQMVYGIKIGIEYPAERVLRASDGAWEKKIIIRVSKDVGDPFSFSGKIFDFITNTGDTLKSAFCESVQAFAVTTFPVYELLLRYSDVNYTYLEIDAATKIKTTIGSDVITANLYTMVVDTVISVEGSNYQIGDIGMVIGSGAGARISVSNIDFTTGAITGVKIDDFGVGYSPIATLEFTWGTNNMIWVNGATTYQMVVSTITNGVFPSNGDGLGKVDLVLGKMAIYPRKYSGTSGWLSSDVKLQDNYYYQIHSYVIESNKSYNDWFNPVKENVHIAGSKSFSNISLNNRYNVN